MFVEKLTKEDIVEYLKKYVWSYRKYAFLRSPKTVENFEVKNGQITCDLNDIGVYYTFRDFTFSEVVTEKPEIEQSWLNFMYAKFGEEYKKAFLNYRANRKDVEIEKAKQRYDQQTKDYVASLDASQEM